MNSNPICQPSPAKKMKCSFLDFVQLLMISQAGQWTQTPSATPLLPKKWNAHFWICSTSDDWPGWLMDSNPIHHPSPPKNMKCSFLYNIEHLMLARLVNGLKPHLPPLFSQKNEIQKIHFFGLRSTSDDWPGWSLDSNPICHPSPAKKWNVHFWIMFNFWWLAGLVNVLEKKPGCSMKSLVFGLCSLLMICMADWWTWTPCSNFTALVCSQKNEMLNFRLFSTSDDQPGWSMDSNPICHPSPAKKMKCSFLYYIQLLMLARLVNELEPYLPSLSSQKNEMLIFELHSTFDDWLGWLMDLNSIHHPSPAKKMKSSFLYYLELLMISRAGWWTRTPSATPLQPKKWNAHFWILFNFWWSAWLVNGLKPHLPPLSSQKNEMLIFGLHSTSDDQPGWLMDSNLIHHPSPAKKMKCSFLDCIHFWWLAGLVDEL